MGAGGRAYCSCDDPLQQQHHCLVILLRWRAEHAVRLGLLPYLFCGCLHWGHNDRQSCAPIRVRASLLIFILTGLIAVGTVLAAGFGGHRAYLDIKSGKNIGFGPFVSSNLLGVSSIRFAQLYAAFKPVLYIVADNMALAAGL